MNLLIATGNPGKLAEYRRYFAVLDATLLAPADLGLRDIAIAETGSSFEANARIKAIAYARLAKTCAVADDSGLEVDALDGAPGIHTARYGGADLASAARRRKLLEALDGVSDPQRRARFVCVIAIADTEGEVIALARGECRGKIAARDHDDGQGFGYDPIFIPEGYALTFGQLRPELKDGLSHRARAASQALPILHEIRSRLP